MDSLNQNELSNIAIVDHGEVFNCEHWYTFHCKSCGRQITKDDSLDNCKYCNTVINWQQPEVSSKTLDQSINYLASMHEILNNKI